MTWVTTKSNPNLPTMERFAIACSPRKNDVPGLGRFKIFLNLFQLRMTDVNHWINFMTLDFRLDQLVVHVVPSRDWTVMAKEGNQAICLAPPCGLPVWQW